jgi:hypothetical protein
MLGYWSFEIVLPPPIRRRTYVLFCSATAPDEEDVAQRIEDYCDANFSPDRIYLIAPESERGAMTQVLESEKFKGRIRDVTQHRNTPKAECLLFGPLGELVSLGRDGPPPEEIAMIKRRGLTRLIREKHVFRSAPSSHHFAVPSGGHAQSFFRTGDAMTDGAAVDFMAFCTLPHIPLGVRHIFCDSGTISPVAYAISALRRRMDETAPFANFSSFESYTGMKKFPFPRDICRSVVLISVTTTGRLAQNLRDTHPAITPDSVIHLFALYDMPDYSSRVVCDLRYHEQDNPEGFEEVLTYEEAKCKLCARRSSLIRISSEQFLPGDVEVKPLRLSTSHKPGWLDPFLRRVVGRGLVKANYRSERARHATSEVFFDLQTLFADPTMLGIDYYVSRMQWLVDLAVPAMLSRIVCLDGKGSEALARLFADRVRGKLGEVPISEYSKIANVVDGHVKDAGATLVVAGAAASGRSLLSVAQKLRDIQPNGAITYVVGLARFPSPETAREVESNLTYGEQSRRYGYHILDRAFLPLVGTLEETCWDEEKELITGLQASSDDSEANRLLERRMESLRRASSPDVRGMSNDVFWDRRDGTPLALRRGFAFFDFDPPSTPSQADVFFTILAVLYDLRASRDTEHTLHQHEHAHRVLSPRCFDRFNDGVIQGSLLRAALPPELDYSASEALSVEMKQVLDVILSSDATDTGEASREFLLALALGRLRLRPNEVRSLKETYGDGRGDPIAKLLWTKIGE